MSRKRATTMIAIATGWVLASGVARSAPPSKPRAAAHPPTAAEFAALKERVDKQYELIMNLTRIESEHFDYLIKLLSNARPGSVPPPPPPVIDRPPPPPAGDKTGDKQPDSADTPGRSRFASITGRVDVKGKPWGPIYVYVDNIKEPAVDRHIEIMQKDRAFVPDVVVAQRGTRVSFPNADPVLHNVFSPSPTQPFDLGSYKQGEKPGDVRLFKPGVVEVFCNMHAKMRANVLVVPNHHYTKVNPDGSFRLDNVPVGARQIVAWTPDARTVSENVNLTAAGANANFALHAEPRAHNRKTGEAYDPYKDKE
jgi:plastocyanin